MIRRLALPACLVLIAALGITYTAVANAAPPQQQAYARYHNDRWHFTIPLPADITYTEYDGPETSQTIQFSDASADRIFMVTAVPFTEMDVALGEEGAPGHLTDQSTSLGIIKIYRDDVLTFAFQRNGISYTVTALPEDEPWLLPILQSWEFTD